MQLSCEIRFEYLTHTAFIFPVVKQIALACVIPEALMDVAAASRERPADLRHKGGHNAVTVRYFFYGCLKQQRTVCRRKCVGDGDRCFVHTRSRFRVETFEGNVEPPEHVEQVGHERILQRTSQYRVSKHAGCKWRQVSIGFICRGAGGLSKVEPLVLKGAHGLEPCISRIAKHLPQEVAGTRVRVMLICSC